MQDDGPFIVLYVAQLLDFMILVSTLAFGT